MHRIIDGIRSLLKSSYVDDESIEKTPQRVYSRLIDKVFSPSRFTDDAITFSETKTFPYTGTGQICISDILFACICSHHLADFYGKVSVTYVPKESIIGLSKVVNVIKKCQSATLQELFTLRICKILNRILQPKFIKVEVEAFHCCISNREDNLQHSIKVYTKEIIHNV